MNSKNPPSITVFGVLVAVATIILIIFSFNYTLLGSLGVESGLLAGATLGPLMYLGASIRGGYRDERGFLKDVTHELGLVALALFVLASALFVNGFFVASCAPARGLIPFLTHAVPILTFNVACGLLIGRISGNRVMAFLAAIAVAALYFAYRIWAWWQNPTFRFASHPFVFVDGDLLKGAGLSHEAVDFRIATILFAIALILIGLAIFTPAQRQTHATERPMIIPVLGASAALLSIATILHFSVASVIEPSVADRSLEMSRETRRGQFVVHSDPKKTTLNDALAITAEAALWGSRLRTRMGDFSASDVHIWLYADSDMLHKFTGAQHVNFAFPAQRTVHISGSVVPHPTLGHELAHVFIGEKATTYVGVPGVFGIVPNQGLSEGLAVLLTPELSIKADLTLEQQAAALAQSETLPDFNTLFSLSPLSFFSHNTSLAYSVAGAYLAELSARMPTNEKRWSLIAKLANDGTIDRAFDSEQARTQFNNDFMQKLKSLALPKDAVPSVLAMFGAPPVLEQKCSDSAQKSPDADDDPIAIAQRFEKEADQNGPNHIAKKQLLLDEAANNYWQGKQQARAVELWRKIEMELLSPARQRQQEAKAIFASTVDSAISKKALDYLVYAKVMTEKSTAAGISFGEELAKRAPADESEAARALSEDVANYLALRVQVLSSGGSAKDIAALEKIASNKQLSANFQLESARLIAFSRAMSAKASLGAEQFQRLASAATRPADQLMFMDSAERADLIANALKLDKADLRKTDMWLLGTQRFD